MMLVFKEQRWLELHIYTKYVVTHSVLPSDRFFQAIKAWINSNFSEFEHFYTGIEEHPMARKNTNWQFASVRLNKSDAPKVEIFAESLDDDLNALFDMFSDDDVKMSLNYSTQRNAWCCTLTPNEKSRIGYGVSMTSWASSAVEAIWISGYKHVVICERKKYPVDDDNEIWG